MTKSEQDIPVHRLDFASDVARCLPSESKTRVLPPAGGFMSRRSYFLT